METSELSKCELSELENADMKQINGGLILIHPYFIKKGVEFVQGIKEGYEDATS